MEILKHSRVIEHKEYSLYFPYMDEPSAGFSFPCDEHGNVDDVNLNRAARENYHKCRIGVTKGEFENPDVQENSWSYKEPAEGKCECGGTVYLESFTNTCDKCGRDYNKSGQMLAPRSQWGEETGEPWYECL